MAFDKTNTAIAFVEDGLFNKEGVEALGKKPVLVVKANIGGTEKEISLWFAKDKETGDYKQTTQGHKFLTGKVDDPYKGVEYNKENSTATSGGVEFSKPQATDNDLPF
tara:strand:+ start:581 stop:904 length:324 start_codon:yes stop_codon:yes gene_type:complete